MTSLSTFSNTCLANACEMVSGVVESREMTHRRT